MIPCDPLYPILTLTLSLSLPLTLSPTLNLPLILLQRGDTTYMTCVTVVTPAWLPMLARDCPLMQWCAACYSLPFSSLSFSSLHWWLTCAELNYLHQYLLKKFISARTLVSLSIFLSYNWLLIILSITSSLPHLILPSFIITPQVWATSDSFSFLRLSRRQD